MGEQVEKYKVQVRIYKTLQLRTVPEPLRAENEEISNKLGDNSASFYFARYIFQCDSFLRFSVSI